MNTEGCFDTKIRHVNDELYYIVLIFKVHKVRDSWTLIYFCMRLADFIGKQKLVIKLISSYPKDIQFYLNKYVKIHCGFIACKNVKQRYHSSGPVRNIVTMMALQAAA
jgi:hypothetical protein